MKKVKWILLSLLVISIIITVILFINFISDKGHQQLTPINKIKELYNIHLYRKSYNIYENDELILDFQVIENGGYIVFDEKQVTYCDSENICNSSKYTYDSENDTIYVETYNKLLNRGTYNINIKEDVVKLTVEQGKRKTVYYFDMPKG